MKNNSFNAVILALCAVSTASADGVDYLIFSYDRPLQLYALLESVEKYVQGIGEMHVVYRSSSARFDEGYAIVQQRFSCINYHKQGSYPQRDFKPITMQATFNSPSKYVIFAVDDIIVKDYIDLAECVHFMEKYSAYGFYLRLGKNLTHSLDQLQPLPPLQELTNDILKWQLNEGAIDWGYPNTVDMTLYKKEDIHLAFQQMSFHSPNSLEGCWSGRTNSAYHGLCYQSSKIVNLPLNLVQDDWYNPNMNFLSSKQLLEIFLAGLKMDTEQLFQVNNRGAHMYYEPFFIKNSWCSN